MIITKKTSLIILFFTLTSFSLHAQLPAVGTSALVGKAGGIAIETTVQGPAAEETPLQVVCVFEYTEGDIFNSPPALPPAANGLLHLDQALNGLITDLRKNGRFAGHLLETLLITPPPHSIKAKKLLLIGLGDRSQFSPDRMVDVGRTGMREALRIGVTSYAHASDLKDAGMDSPTALIAGNVVKGALEAYRTERYLKTQKASASKPITKLTLLAGPPFFTTTGEGIKAVLANPGQGSAQ